MTIQESDLPGVGKKHVIDLDDGGELIVITHNTGKREVFRRPDPSVDSERLFELTDQLARTVGTILEGAYFQPIEAEKRETTLPGGILIEWYDIPPGSPLIGETIERADVGKQTGVTIVAVQRGEETIRSPSPDTELHEADTLVVIGTDEQCESFESILTSDN
jgi:TrkA domain protein